VARPMGQPWGNSRESGEAGQGGPSGRRPTRRSWHAGQALPPAGRRRGRAGLPAGDKQSSHSDGSMSVRRRVQPAGQRCASGRARRAQRGPTGDAVRGWGTRATVLRYLSAASTAPG
jgi:hypothetical protein